MDLASDYRFAVGQKVVSRAAHYRAGEVGTVVARQPGPTRPGYVVDFGDGLRAFLTEDQLEPYTDPADNRPGQARANPERQPEAFPHPDAAAPAPPGRGGYAPGDRRGVRDVDPRRLEGTQAPRDLGRGRARAQARRGTPPLHRRPARPGAGGDKPLLCRYPAVRTANEKAPGGQLKRHRGHQPTMAHIGCRPVRSALRAKHRSRITAGQTAANKNSPGSLRHWALFLFACPLSGPDLDSP